LKRDLPNLLACLDAPYNRGVDIRRLYTDLVEHFRNLIVAGMGNRSNNLIDAPDHERERLTEQARGAGAAVFSHVFKIMAAEIPALKFAGSPKLAFETVLFRILETQPSLPVDTLIEKLELLRKDFASGKAVPPPASPVSAADVPAAASAPPPADPAIKEPTSDYGSAPPSNPSTRAGSDVEADNPAALWKQLLDCIAREHPALGGALANAKLLEVTTAQVVLKVPGSAFNINRLRKKDNSVRLEKICSDFLGRPVTVAIRADVAGQQANSKQKKLDNKHKQDVLSHPLIEDAIEIFQGEVVEVRSLNNKK